MSVNWVFKHENAMHGKTFYFRSVLPEPLFWIWSRNSGRFVSTRPGWRCVCLRRRNRSERLLPSEAHQSWSSNPPELQQRSETHNQWYNWIQIYLKSQVKGQRSEVRGQRSPLVRPASAAGAHHLCGSAALNHQLFWSETGTLHGCCQHTLYTHTHIRLMILYDIILLCFCHFD